MAYVLNHPTDGVFVGYGLGLAFFSALETAGQDTACTVQTKEEADEWLAEMSEKIPGLEIVAVSGGHWTALQAAGLNVGDMPSNSAR